MNPLLLGLLLAVPASLPSPTIDVVADCEGLTLTTVGWPEGSTTFVGVGDAPPGALPVNASVRFPATIYRSYGWIVMVTAPGEAARQVSGLVDCPTFVDDAPEQPVVIGEVVPVAQVTTVELVESPWVGLELAPPW